MIIKIKVGNNNLLVAFLKSVRKMNSFPNEPRELFPGVKRGAGKGLSW
jgi:hypothetical protein